MLPVQQADPTLVGEVFLREPRLAAAGQGIVVEQHHCILRQLRPRSFEFAELVLLAFGEAWLVGEPIVAVEIKKMDGGAELCEELNRVAVMEVEPIGDVQAVRDFLRELEKIGRDIHGVKLADVVVAEQRGEDRRTATCTPILHLSLAASLNNGAAAVLEMPAEGAFPSPEPLL